MYGGLIPNNPKGPAVFITRQYFMFFIILTPALSSSSSMKVALSLLLFGIKQLVVSCTGSGSRIRVGYDDDDLPFLSNEFTEPAGFKVTGLVLFLDLCAAEEQL